MKNIYIGDFSEEEKNYLAEFSGFTIWKIFSGFYANHSTWNKANRIYAERIHLLIVKLHEITG